MHYKFAFSKFGLLFFALLMVPNIIFFQFFPETDIVSKAPVWLDLVENITRVLLVAASVLIVPASEKERKKNWLYFSLLFLTLYYLCWAIRFTGVTHFAILLLLSVLPVLFLVCEQVWLDNFIAVGCTLLFGVSHIAVTCYSLF